jgi:hypothetical protein
MLRAIVGPEPADDLPPRSPDMHDRAASSVLVELEEHELMLLERSEQLAEVLRVIEIEGGVVKLAVEDRLVAHIRVSLLVASPYARSTLEVYPDRPPP